MNARHLTNRACLALLLFASAGVTQAAEGLAERKQLTLREGEATWIGRADQHARHGAEATMAVGANDGDARSLIRFDVATRMTSYEKITKAMVELTLADVQGTWDNQAFELHQVNDGRWGAETATWASANDPGIFMLGSGEPIRTAWHEPGCAGWSRGAKLAEAKLGSVDKGKPIRFEITDAKFLARLRDLAHHPDPQGNAGFQITAPGLAAKPGNAAFFATWKAAIPQRPVLTLDVEGYAPPKTVLRYDLPAGGRVSIVIHDSKGKLVRELLHGAERTAGAHEEGWDGKDQLGNPLPAGTYSWKLLRTPGLRAEYLLTLGTNPKMPWGAWPGNHNPVTTVAADESGLYFAAGSNEGPPMMVKQSHAEKLLWTAAHFRAFGGAQSLCADGGKVFLIETGANRPNRLDAATGKRESTLDAIPAGNNPLLFMDLAARNGRLLVSYYDRNVIRWFDVEGNALGECTLPEPTGVALLENGDALVISKGAVLRVPLGGEPAALIDAALLTAPWRLDVAASGDILVAESDGMWRWAQRDLKQPESAFPTDKGRQVKRFGPDGTLKAAYGRPGGRTLFGAYRPEDGFSSDLSDVAATPDGGFLVADLRNPTRAVAYDAKGTLVREWYGGQTYGPAANADPDDPSLVYMAYGWGGIIRYNVDYAKRTWKVDAVFDTGVPMWKVDSALHLFVRRREGKLLLCTSITPVVFELDERNGTLKPMAAVSFPAGGGPDPPDTVLKRMKPDGNWRHFVYSWADVNGNGRPDDDEFSFPGGVFRGGGMYVDDDLNWYLPLSRNLQLFSKLNVGYARLTPREFTALGAPIYDNAKQEGLGEPPMDEYGFGQFGDVAIWRDADGSVYCIYNTNDERKFGEGFWSPRTGGNRLARWNADGKLQWVVGRHSATFGAAPGEGRYFWRIMGTTHGCIVVGDMENSLQHVWDRDGLWVGRLLEAPLVGENGAPPQAYGLCGEQFGGSLHTDPDTGEVLFFGSGINNVPVFRITGWDGWTRQAGTVEIER